MSFNENNVSRCLFADENDFKKKLRSLKTYCPRAYKEFVFDVRKKIESAKIDGKYEVELQTSAEFKFIYGQIKITYGVANGLIIMENIEPSQFLLDGYKTRLELYRGIYYRNQRDKFKIDLFLLMKRKEELLYERKIEKNS